MTLEEQFGENARRRRTAIKLTQEELAARAKIHTTDLSEIESGKRNPTIRIIGRVANALGVEAGELFALVKQVPFSIVPAKQNAVDN